ncbi:MAG: mannose-1-phosphate guanylyltransferase [Deltaproteobacteria bacterium]|nr:mannose-1-phosphate guanylyltransferase [Deltaproteobacteria bacterium]
MQKSYDRVAGIITDDRIIVLTNDRFTNLVREQLPGLPPKNIIGEPMRRDTAAAVCLGALLSIKRFGNPVIVTLTADHLIEPGDLFRQTMLSAVRMARETEALYTFGIKPSYAATGYGYLEIGEKFADDRGIEHFHLVSFKEKPEKDTARQYVESGRYLWNSGMFVWTADAIFGAFAKHLPEHLEHLTKALEKEGSPEWQNALQQAFESIEKISIDYAVMEKAEDVRCAASDFTWKDVGSWHALADFLPKDVDGNCCLGTPLKLDAKRNLVFCEDPEETVMLVGVQDLVIARAGNATLIAEKERTEEVKKLVEEMVEES